MEPAGAPPQGCAPAREAEEPPGSPALPGEEPQGGQPAGPLPGEATLPAAAGRERGHRGAGPQGPGGRAARGRGRRAPGRRGGEEGGRAGRRPRVTVDSSKAKTSLEALKISLRQLRWREWENFKISLHKCSSSQLLLLQQNEDESLLGQTVDFKLADFSRPRESVGKILSRFEEKNNIKKRNTRKTLLLNLLIILKALPFKCLEK